MHGSGSISHIKCIPETLNNKRNSIDVIFTSSMHSDITIRNVLLSSLLCYLFHLKRSLFISQITNRYCSRQERSSLHLHKCREKNLQSVYKVLYIYTYIYTYICTHIHIYVNTNLAKIDLSSENYQILDDCIILKYLKSKFLKILLGEEETGIRMDGDQVQNQCQFQIFKNHQE